MKILLTCDPEIPVPPINYGGIERIVDGLAKGYVQQGHTVYLLANSNSTCTFATKIYGWPANHSRGTINILKNSLYLTKVVKDIKPDVVHSFSRLLYGYAVFLKRKVLFIQSYQRKISAKSTSMAIKLAGKYIHFTSCADHMLAGLPNRSAFTSIFNFTDVDYFRLNDTQSRDHLMFLGRIEDIKGTKEAIEVAIGSNNKIVVAGNIQPGHESYFHKFVKPLLDHPLVNYIGEVNDTEKLYYLQRAKALLFPIKWQEPFGIVLAEALACGTPVLAFNIGSTPEIIVDNLNGFLVSSTDEMSVAVNKINDLNRVQIREDAVKRFSLQHITCEYLQLFSQKLNGLN